MLVKFLRNTIAGGSSVSVGEEKILDNGEAKFLILIGKAEAVDIEPAPVVEPEPIIEEIPEPAPAPAKKKSGRPKGSKNKKGKK